MMKPGAEIKSVDEDEVKETRNPDLLECKVQSVLAPKESLDETEASSLVEKSQLLSVLESEWSCAICGEVFIDPSSLLCGHTFCAHCLRQSLVQKDTCPMCREPCFGVNPKKNVSMSAMIDSAFLESSEDLRTKRVEALEEREEDVQKAKAAEASSIASRGLYYGDDFVEGLLRRLDTSRRARREMEEVD